MAAFGPYVGLPGVRTEQVAVYTLCGLGLAFFCWLHLRPPVAGVVVCTLLALQVGLAAFGAWSPPSGLPAFVRGDLTAGVDNLLLPLAVIALAWMAAGSGRHVHRVLEAAAATLVVLACGNAVLATASIGGDLVGFLGAFWSDGPASGSVAARAAELGRYSGIFNQPAEAGQMYSMALLAALWLFRVRPARLAVAAVVITVGGILTVSKIFLLVGLPVAAWQILAVSTGRQRRLAATAAVLAAGFGAARLGWLPTWAGTDYLLRLVDGGDRGAVDLYTAGRLGGQSTLRSVAESVLASSPWFGFGASGLTVAYDNGWVEALVVAGLFGAATYTAVLAVLAAAWWRRRTVVDKAWSRFSGGLVLVLVGASMGLPALTANRVATVSWLLVTLLLLCPPPDGPNVLKPTKEVSRLVRIRKT